MDINQKFLKAIKPPLEILRQKMRGEFVIFGSSPLYLLGILKFKGIGAFNDLDIAIKDESIIPKEAKLVTFQKNREQRLPAKNKRIQKN